MRDLAVLLVFKLFGGSESFIRWREWKALLKWLDPRDGERILDVACGNGRFTLKAAEAASAEVYGIDLSERLISSAASLSKRIGVHVRFQAQNAERLGFPRDFFDKVVSSSSLEHFQTDSQALREMWRVLKPRGAVVLTTDSLSYPISPELKARHKRIASVVNYYTDQELSERLKESGFEPVKSAYLLTSPVSSALFNLGIRLAWWQRGVWAVACWFAISLLAYPLCIVSDALWGRNGCGYTLIVKAVKVPRH